MNVENVLHDFYEVLECLRYPELAQTPLREFGNLLRGPKRTSLFLWLLQQVEDLQHLQFLREVEYNEEILKHKLYECYSQFGLCENTEVFFGNCPMIQQLTFLNFLTLFVKNVHLADGDIRSEKQIVNASFNDSFVNMSLNSPKLNRSICQTPDQPSPEVKISPETTTENNIDESLKKFQNDLKELQEEEIQNANETLNNFKEAFLPIVLEHQHKDSKNPTNFNKDLTSEFEELYSKLSIISKTQANLETIKSRPLPNPVTRTRDPLSKMIQDTLVEVEQACNVINQDMPQNSTFN